MELRPLAHFVAVYEQGSLSSASRRRFIAQPSLSAAIKQLENELGQQLFLRHARGVKATEAAEQLYPLAKQLLAQADAIHSVFSGGLKKEPFRLGVTKGLGVSRMSALLKAFTSARDALELSLVPPEDSSDARIITRDLLQQGEHYQLIWQDSYQLAVPANHPLSLQNSISINDLTDMAFIQRSPCEGCAALRHLAQQAGIKLDIRARIQTIEYALGLVSAGVGCALVPVHEELHSPDIRFVPLQGLELSREIGLAWRQQTEIISTFIKLALDSGGG
jgi:LysR family transcriptional regulator, benzoate and cis,cis-muconate-responsive activator of ben and cat genes